MCMGCVCISIATWTDRKVTHAYTTNVMQWSCKRIHLSEDHLVQILFHTQTLTSRKRINGDAALKEGTVMIDTNVTSFILMLFVQLLVVALNTSNIYGHIRYRLVTVHTHAPLETRPLASWPNILTLSQPVLVTCSSYPHNAQSQATSEWVQIL